MRGREGNCGCLQKPYVALGPTNPCVDGVSQFRFTITSRDLEVQVLPSWFHSVNMDSSISFRNLHAMNCPTTYFSNTMSNYFDCFSHRSKKLSRGSHSDVGKRVVFVVACNLVSGFNQLGLCGCNAAMFL